MLKIPFLKQMDFTCWQRYANKCQSCGLCVNACPLGRLTPGGLHSPRGRIALIRAFIKGQISGKEALPIFSVCLHCGQCEKSCPADLPLQDLFTEFAVLLRSRERDPLHAALYILQFFPALSALLQFAGALAARTRMKKKLPPLLRDLPLKAFTSGSHKKTDSGSDKNALLLFSGCLSRNIDPSIAMACAKLAQNSSHPLISPSLPCCGRVNRLLGKKGESLALVRKNLKIISRLEFEYVLTPCPACAQEMSHYWPRIKELNKAERVLADRIAEKVLDPIAFAQKAIYGSGRAQNNASETPFFHISCLSPASSRTAIEKLFPQGKYAVAENGENCCGASLLCAMGKNQSGPQLSGKLGRKLRDLALAQGADRLFTTCPACKLHLQKIMARQGDPVHVEHVAELYARIASINT